MKKPTISIGVFYKVKNDHAGVRSCHVDVDLYTTEASIQESIAGELRLNQEDITLQASKESPLITPVQLMSLGLKTVTEFANSVKSGKALKAGGITVYPADGTFSALEGMAQELLVYKALNRNMDFKRAIPTTQGLKKYDAKVLLQLIAHMYSIKDEVNSQVAAMAVALGGIKNLSSLAQVRSVVEEVMAPKRSK